MRRKRKEKRRERKVTVGNVEGVVSSSDRSGDSSPELLKVRKSSNSEPNHKVFVGKASVESSDVDSRREDGIACTSVWILAIFELVVDVRTPSYSRLVNENVGGVGRERKGVVEERVGNQSARIVKLGSHLRAVH